MAEAYQWFIKNINVVEAYLFHITWSAQNNVQDFLRNFQIDRKHQDAQNSESNVFFNKKILDCSWLFFKGMFAFTEDLTWKYFLKDIRQKKG